MPKKPEVPVRVQRLLAKMSGGKLLVESHDAEQGVTYFLEPGGRPIGAWTAERAKEQLVPAHDALFPELSQTWSLPR